MEHLGEMCSLTIMSSFCNTCPERPAHETKSLLYIRYPTYHVHATVVKLWEAHVWLPDARNLDSLLWWKLMYFHIAYHFSTPCGCQTYNTIFFHLLGIHIMSLSILLARFLGFNHIDLVFWNKLLWIKRTYWAECTTQLFGAQTRKHLEILGQK